MVRAALLSSVIALAATASNAVKVNWVDWVSSRPNSADGVLNVDGEIIGVTFTNTVNNWGVQTGGGTDYWTAQGPHSPYERIGPNGVDNRPTGTDIIALGDGGTRTIRFSKQIEGLYFSFVSWNGNVGTFSETKQLLSLTGQDIDGSGNADSPGYWGSGDVAVAGNVMTAIGGEPHGTLFTDAALSTFSLDSRTEYWHGFTVGVAGTPT